MARLDDQYPGLPIKMNPCSNGEFIPLPPTDIVREAARRARAEAERNARRLGLSRRHFLLSSMGAATTLAALSACSREAARSNSDGPPGSRLGSPPGGSYVIPPAAATDSDAARRVL